MLEWFKETVVNPVCEMHALQGYSNHSLTLSVNSGSQSGWNPSLL